MNSAKAHHPNNCLILNNRNGCGGDEDDVKTTTTTKSDKTKINSNSISYKGTDDDDDDDNIDSIDFNENRRSSESNCKWLRRQQSLPQRCVINDNTVRCANDDDDDDENDLSEGVRIYHHHHSTNSVSNGVNHFKKNVRNCSAQTANRYRYSTAWILFCTAVSLLLLNIDIIKAEPQQHQQQQQQQQSTIQCEAKVLEETPPDPVNRQYILLFYNKFRTIYSIWSIQSEIHSLFRSTLHLIAV